MFLYVQAPVQMAGWSIEITATDWCVTQQVLMPLKQGPIVKPWGLGLIWPQLRMKRKIPFCIKK